MGKRNKKVYSQSYVVPPILAKTPNQQLLMDAIKYNDQVITTGSAGTGKTFITAGLAADWYAKSPKRKIIITRPMIPVGEDIGHLPGDLSEKTVPWALPVLEVIKQRVGANKLKCDMDKSIEIVPLQMMRGRTFDDCYILADECQNLSVDQAKMLITRVGENSKLLINGDLKQKDIPVFSGLAWLLQQIEKYYLPVPVIEFDLNDCQRSGICKMWLEVMEWEDHQ
jgi:phosphate starvation-inducible PhoH-like protein